MQNISVYVTSLRFSVARTQKHYGYSVSWGVEDYMNESTGLGI